MEWAKSYYGAKRLLQRVDSMLNRGHEGRHEACLGEHIIARFSGNQCGVSHAGDRARWPLFRDLEFHSEALRPLYEGKWAKTVLRNLRSSTYLIRGPATLYCCTGHKT